MAKCGPSGQILLLLVCLSVLASPSPTVATTMTFCLLFLSNKEKCSSFQEVMWLWGNWPKSLEDLGLLSHLYHLLVSWDLNFHIYKMRWLTYIPPKVPNSKILWTVSLKSKASLENILVHKTCNSFRKLSITYIHYVFSIPILSENDAGFVTTMST